MREIKFRYWNGGAMVYEDMPLPDPTWILHNKMYAPYGENVLMQYTGLRDKNGIEIYEGDLLKHDLWGTTEVIWDKEGACFRGKNEDHDITLAHHQLERSRVIGNIYEDKRS